MRAILENLTKNHDRLWFDEDTGKYVRVEEQALIQQLREAVFGGMETGRGGSGFNARMPISSAALDRYEQIDEEITEVWLQAFPSKVPGAEKIESLLSQIVAFFNNDTIVAITIKKQRVDNRDTLDEHWWVEHSSKEFKLKPLMQRWETLIRELFDPPRLAEIDAECFVCGEEWAWKQVNGENVPYRVLAFARDEKGETQFAQCAACGNRWNKTEFEFLLRGIEENEKRKTRREQTTKM